MILVSLITLVVLPQSDSIFDRPGAALEIFASLYTFRFLLMILFTVASTAFAIKILRKYKVNYLFIFELDPNYKITFMQLLRVSSDPNNIFIDLFNASNNLGILFPRTDLHH
jgi:hypothetical protein